MSYIVPSTLVYQQLESAGGAIRATPNLDAVIIGPLYNIVDIVPTDGNSLFTSQVAAISAVDDGDVVMQPGATITDFPALVADLSGESESAIRMVIPTPVAGQVFDQSSASLFVSEMRFSTGTGTFALPASAVVDKNLVDYSASLDFTATDALPDGVGVHLAVGDILIGTTRDDEDAEIDTFSTTVIAIDYEGETLRLSTALPANRVDESDVFVFTVYRASAGKFLDADDLTLTNVDTLDEVTIPFDLSVFSAASNAEDYQILSGTFHVGYRALRTDKTTTVLVINDEADRLAQLGVADERNPLGLAVQIASANTVTIVKAVSIGSDDLSGYLSALELIEEEATAYALCPLTQNESILASLKNHVVQLSTPEQAGWRVGIVNTEIRDTKAIGQANETATATGTLVITSDRVFVDVTTVGVSFVADGVTPTDLFIIPTGTNSGTYSVAEVISNTRVELDVDAEDVTGGGVVFYIERQLTKTQRAEEVAAKSTVFGSSRIWHVQPDLVGVDVQGVTKYLPGYYLCAAVAGITAGFPVQQGFTNIAVAGITDLRNSNFFFSKTEMNTMAEAGTMLFVQSTQGGTPFCRHALTTDVSVLQYREILKVKNADFLSYYFKRKIDPFIGSWNITEDTLNAERQVIDASAEILMSEKLPRIGAPLLSYEVLRLEQSEVNRDSTIIEMRCAIVDPNNYVNLFLIF
jgi:hypothetical protein